MANIGMTGIIYAPVDPDSSKYSEAAEEPAISYDDQRIIRLEHARRAQVTYNTAEGELYGDDALQERYAVALSADIEVELAELGVDDIRDAGEGSLTEPMGLETLREGTGDSWYSLVTEQQTYVGFGFIQTRHINGVTSYRAFKFHKVMFHIATEETQTREEQIQWGCPILRGHAVLCTLWNDEDEAAEDQLRDYQDFVTRSDAETWLEAQFPYIEPPDDSEG